MSRFRFIIAAGLVLAVAAGTFVLTQGTYATQYENQNENENTNANANVNANANANANANVNSNTNASVAATHWRGTLTAMSGPTLPATLTLQVEATAYTVNVTANTMVVRKFGGRSSLDEFAIGDTLRVWGTLTGTTIDATKVKNYSIQRVGGTFQGTILSVDSAALTFVLDTRKRDDQTVQVVSTTKIFQGNRAGDFADLAAGQSVKVIGVWRRGADQIRADRILIKLTSINGTIDAANCAGNSFTLDVKQRGETVMWTVGLTADTVLRDKELDPIACADLAADHKVHVRGLRTGSTAVNALWVIDLGAKKKPSVLNGEVSSLDATVKTFVVTKKGNAMTVQVTAETIIVNKQGRLITFEQLVNGHDVSIRGTSTGSTFTANLIIDKDLPAD